MGFSRNDQQRILKLLENILIASGGNTGGGTPGGSTAANQTLANQLLTDIITELKSDVALEESLMIDAAGELVWRVSERNQETGAKTITYNNIDGNVVIPTIPLIPASTAYDTWAYIPGNSVETTYYTGVAAGNPSGNTNVQNVIYKRSTTTVMTQTFEWDASDRFTKVTPS